MYYICIYLSHLCLQPYIQFHDMVAGYVHMYVWIDELYILHTHIYLWQIHHRSTYYSLVPWIDRCRKPPQWKDRWRSPQKLAKSTGAVDKPRLMGVACHLPSNPRFRQKKGWNHKKWFNRIHKQIYCTTSNLFLNQNHQISGFTPSEKKWRFKAILTKHTSMIILVVIFGLFSPLKHEFFCVARIHSKIICILHTSPNQKIKQLIVLCKLLGKDLRYVPVYVGSNSRVMWYIMTWWLTTASRNGVHDDIERMMQVHTTGGTFVTSSSVAPIHVQLLVLGGEFFFNVHPMGKIPWWTYFSTGLTTYGWLGWCFGQIG